MAVSRSKAASDQARGDRFGRARERMNGQLRSRAREILGERGLDELIRGQVEASLETWLEPCLRTGKPSTGRTAPDPRQQLVDLFRRHIRSPSLILGDDAAPLASVLGVSLVLEVEAWRQRVGQSAFPGLQISGQDLSELEDRFETLIAVDYLEALKSRVGQAGFHQFLSLARTRLTKSGNLLVAESVAFQDDVVSQLAMLEFEILEIEPLRGADTVAVVATRVD